MTREVGINNSKQGSINAKNTLQHQSNPRTTRQFTVRFQSIVRRLSWVPGLAGAPTDTFTLASSRRCNDTTAKVNCPYENSQWSNLEVIKLVLRY